MTIPEIQRTNLSNVVLLLKSMGVKNLLEPMWAQLLAVLQNLASKPAPEIGKSWQAYPQRCKWSQLKGCSLLP